MLRKTGPNTVNPDDLLTKHKLEISEILATYMKKPDAIYKNDNNEECDASLQQDRINIATNGLNKIIAAKDMLEVKAVVASIRKALGKVDKGASNRFKDRADNASNYSVNIPRGVDPRPFLLALSEVAYNTTASKVSQSWLKKEIDTAWEKVANECEKIAPANEIKKPETQQYTRAAELHYLTNNKLVVAKTLKEYIDKQNRLGAGILNVRRDKDIFKQRLSLAQDCLNSVLNASNSREILEHLTTASTKNQAIKMGGKLQKRFDKLIPELQTALEIQKPVNPVDEMLAVTQGIATPLELRSLPSIAGHFKQERRTSSTEQKTAEPASTPTTRPRRSSSSG